MLCSTWLPSSVQKLDAGPVRRGGLRVRARAALIRDGDSGQRPAALESGDLFFLSFDAALRSRGAALYRYEQGHDQEGRGQDAEGEKARGHAAPRFWTNSSIAIRTTCDSVLRSALATFSAFLRRLSGIRTTTFPFASCRSMHCNLQHFNMLSSEILENSLIYCNEMRSAPIVGRLGIGRRLRDTRAKLGLSLYALSKRTGGKISASHIGQIESGRIRKIEIPTAVALASALGMSVADLISDEVRPLDHDAPREEHAVDVPLLGVSAGGPPIEAEEMKHVNRQTAKICEPGEYGG